MAYLEIGKRYGILHIDQVISSPYDYYTLDYEFYQDKEKAWHEYKKMLESYNREVAKYNQEISGKVYTIGTPEEKMVSDWEADLLQQEQALNGLEQELGKHWYESEFSSYTVEDVHIHW